MQVLNFCISLYKGMDRSLYKWLLSVSKLDPNSKGMYVFYLKFKLIIMCVILVLAALKKNYTRLCYCLPRDYKKTINKLNEVFSLSDSTRNHLVSSPNADVANQELITLLISGLRSDIDALSFCDIVEKLVDDMPSQNVIDSLRNGTYVIKKIPLGLMYYFSCDSKKWHEGFVELSCLIQ